MEKHEKQITQLLHSAGAEVVRKKKHVVYRLPGGRKFVRPSTPSDWRGDRNSLADLRRFLKEKPELPRRTVQQIPNESRPESRRKRMRVPNRDPREKAAVVIPFLSTGQPNRVVEDIGVQKRFESVYDLVNVIEEVDSYWDLDECGRVRVLMTLASRFAKTEALSVRYCSVSAKELEPGTDFLKSTTEAFSRLDMEWGDTWGPSLFVHDPVEGDLLIETNARDSKGNRDHFTIIPAEFDSGVSLALYPLWNDDFDGGYSDSEPDEYIFYAFLGTSVMKKYGHHFEKCACWIDPSRTRSVIREILAFHQSSDDLDIPHLSDVPVHNSGQQALPSTGLIDVISQ
jgi:hypothetical protein